MKIRLIATCLAAAALSVPAVGYSADNTMSKDSMATPAPKKEGGVVTDAMITTKVKAEFAKDKAVSAMKIKVDTDKGVVTLSGTAKTRFEADKAISIAKNTNAVATVRDDMKVQMN